MSRYRVTKVHFDDGAFGYTAPPSEEVIADWLDRAEAKSILRHFESKYWYDEWTTIYLEVMYDGEWSDVSQGWCYRQLEEQENWFNEKGYDYMWWLQFGEIRSLSK